MECSGLRHRDNQPSPYHNRYWFFSQRFESYPSASSSSNNHQGQGLEDDRQNTIPLVLIGDGFVSHPVYGYGYFRDCWYAAIRRDSEVSMYGVVYWSAIFNTV